MLLTPWFEALKQRISLAFAHRRDASKRRRRHRPKSIQQLEDRVLLSAISWDGGAGTFQWNDDANWSTDTLPGSGDDVTIGDLSGTPTITSNSTVAVMSLTSAEHIDVAGGSFTVTGTATVNGGLTQSGGTTTLGSGTIANVVSLYKAEGNANDSADGNNGSLVNGATTTTAGKLGSAFSFDGVDDYVSIPHSANLDLTTAATYSAWIRLDQLPSSAGHIMSIMAKSANGNDLDFQIHTDNRVYFYAATGSVVSSTALAAGTWYHVAATYEGSNFAKVYINGALEGNASIAGTRAANTNPLIIGENSVFTGRQFQGRIDEATVFDRALTDGEIANLAAATTSTASGSTLTIPTGKIVGPVSVSATGTLGGSGTVAGNLTNAATVAPGSSPGIITVNGNYTQDSAGTLAIEIGGTNPGTPDFDQLIVNGTVTLAGSLNVSLINSFVPANGNSFTIIDNDGTDAVSGTFSGLNQGSQISVGGSTFTISYIGGTGNDVVLTATTLVTSSVAISGNDLVISDPGNDTNDTLTVSTDGANVTISDPNNTLSTAIAGATGNGTNTIVVPLSAFTGSIIVNGGDGNDSLAISLGSGNFGRVITFNGEGQTTGDSLTVTGGGTFASVAHNFTNANDGSISVTGNSTISYTGLEPITDNLSATDRVFTFNGGAETITLTDAAGANMTIDSTLSESVTFANPTNSLTINAGSGNDIVTISSVDADGPYRASLTVNGDANTDTLNLNAALTLGSASSSGSVTFHAENINLNASISTDAGSAVGGGDVSLSGTGIDLGANVVIDTDRGSGTDGNVTINAPINADSAANNRTLTLTGGDGTISLGNIGASRNVQSFTVTSAAVAALQQVRTRSGGINVTATAITLNANLATDGLATAGGVSLTGAVTLGGSLTIDTDSSTDANFSVSGTINADNSTTANRTLIVQADTGTATFSGSIGAGTDGALADLDVTATTITLNGATIQVDDQAASAQTVTFNGAVVLGTGVTIDTDAASGNDNSVRFTKLSDAISGANSLTVNAGGGSAQFDGAIGSPTRLTDFDVTAATILLPNDVLTDGGSLTFVGNVILNLAGQLTIDTERLDDSNAGSVTFSGGSISAGGANRDLVINTTTGGTFASGNISLSTVDSNAGFALRNLTLNAARATTPGTGTLADVTLAGAITLASNGNLDIDGQTVTLSTTSSDVAISGTGTISIDASRNVALASGSSLTTVNGNLTINANQQSTPMTGNIIGIDVNNGLIQATGTGVVTVKGRGGNDGGGNQYGVQVHSGGDIIGGTSGLMTVQGTGGGSSGGSNFGVRVFGTGSTVSSNGGSVQITGLGGGTGTSGSNMGVVVQSAAQVTAGGSGLVTVQGTGSTTDSGSLNYGVRVVGTDSIITSGGGNVLITGQGGGAGSAGSNDGIRIEGAGQVSAGGTGQVTVQGTGSSTDTGATNYGVRVNGVGTMITSGGGNVQITGQGGGTGAATVGVGVSVDDNSTVTSGGGNVSITGIEGIGSSSHAIRIVVSATVTTATNGGNVTLTGNSIRIDTSVGTPATISSQNAATVTLKPFSAGVAIDLGLSTDAIGGPLGLTDAELDRITAGTVNIGDANSGTITVSAAIDHANNLSLTTGAGITVNQAITMASDKHFTATTASTSAGINLATANSDIAATGTGTISLTAARDIALASGASVTTVNGSLTVSVNQQTTATTGNFIGIDVNGAEVKTTGSGAVNLTGRGGTIGVAVRSAGNVSATGGTVTIVGTGNNGVIDGNIGVSLGSAATVTSTTGAMSITGTGGITNGQANDGIRIDGGARVDSTGGATVTLNGTGKGADGGNNYGVRISGANSKITSTAGDILVTGVGAIVTHAGNVGVAVVDGGQINATGSAKITVNATGGIAAINNVGLLIGTNGGITSVNGDVALNGTAADSTGTGNYGISILSGGFVTTTGTANVTLTGTTTSSDPAVGYGISLGSSGTASFTLTGSQNTLVANSMVISATATINAGSNTVNLRQKATDGSIAIDLGAADSSTVLGLTDAELDTITAGTVNIGNANSGTITVSSAITHGNNLSLTTGAGITVNQAVTMASDKNFSATSTSTTAGISLPLGTSDISASGSGTLALMATRNIALGSGSSLTTVNGNLDLLANWTTTTGGSFVGIDVLNGLIQATGTGAVTVQGKGGNDSSGSQIGVLVRGGGDIIGGTGGLLTVDGQGGSSTGIKNNGVVVTDSGSTVTTATVNGSNVKVTGTGGGSGTSQENNGVLVISSGRITAGGTGTVTVEGTGGNVSGNYNSGVAVSSTSGPGITSSGGNVSVKGTGGGTGTSSENHGVAVVSAGLISAGGTGTVTVEGFGGNTSGSGSYNIGVVVVSISGTGITSTGGNVSITGTGGGGGTSTNNSGVTIAASSTVSAGGSGSTVTIIGQGGNSTGGSNDGILINNSTVTSSGGDLFFTGTPGTSSGVGLKIEPSATISTLTNGGTVTLIGDSMSIDAAATIIAQSGSSVTLRQKTNGVAINLGGADAASTLGLTDAELDRLTAGTVNIGSENSGTITVSAAIDHGNNLVLTTGAGITVNDAVTMAADKSLTANAVGTINLANGNADVTATGTGTIALTAARNIVLASGSSLTTANGNLTVNANQQVTPTTGNFVGVDVNNGLIQATGTGVVTVQGKGGNDSSGSQVGVRVQGGGDILGGTTGTVSVVGVGGAVTGGGGQQNSGVQVTGLGSTISSTGANVQVTGSSTATTGASPGVFVDASGQITSGGSGGVTVSGTGGIGGGDHGVLLGTAGKITSSSGNVVVNGFGGGSSGSNENTGVFVAGGEISAGSSGTVTVTGTGGVGTGGSNHGLMLQAAGTITSNGGHVLAQGFGGAGSGSLGVFVHSSGGAGVITAGGSGTVTVEGSGGTGVGTNTNTGVLLNGGTITSSGGAVSITGTEGTGSSSYAITNQSTGTISHTNNGSVTLIGNSVSLIDSSTISAGSVTFRQRTNGVAIDLGSTSETNGGPLSLSDVELDRVTAGTINIGNANSGTITVSAAIDHATTNLSLTTGGSINFSGSSALLDANGGNVTLTASSGAITSGGGSTDVRANGVTLTGGVSGIGSNINPFITDATSLTATVGGNGASYLSEIDTVNVVSLSNHTGSVNLMSGTFRIAPGGGINGFSPVFIDSAAILQLNGNELYLNSLSGSGRITNDSTTAGILHVFNQTSSTFSGVLGGSGMNDNNFSLTTENIGQGAGGTFTLTGANSYTGTTTVNYRTLAINGSVTSNVVVGAIGTLNGSGTITGNVSGTGTFSPGNSPGVMTINGNFTPSGTVNFEVNNAWTTAGTDFDQYVVNGAVDLTGATVTFSNTNDTAAPTANSLIKLIHNDGTGDATTVASTPAQGAVVTIGSRSFKLFYNGGDGNDVVLVENSTPTVVYVDDSFAQTDGTVIADADLGTTGSQAAVKGITAFASINAALAAVSSSGTIIVNGGTYSEAVSLTGTRTLEITGPNSAQTVIIDDLTTIAGTPVVIEGTSNLTVGDADDRTLAGVISGSGSFTKQGAGTYTLTAANTYSAATTISAGTLALQSTYGSSSFSIAASSVLELNVASGTTNYGTASFNGAGTLRKTGTGTATWPATAATFNLGSGALIDIQAGVFTGGSFGNEVWTNNLSDFQIASGAEFHGVEASIRVDAITGSGIIKTGFASGGGQVTIGVDHGTSTFDGVITNNGGSGVLIKEGTGTITLNGANSYSGATTVSAGTLKLGNAAALGSTGGGTTVSTGAVLDLNGRSIDAEAVTLNGTGISSGGALINSSGTAASLSGNITLASASSIGGSGNATYSGTVNGGFGLTLVGTGTKTFSGIIGDSTPLTSITQDDSTGAVRFNENVTVGSSGATLNANVTLDGLTFTSGGAVTLGNASSDALTISGAAVAVTTTAGSIVLNSTTAANQDFTLTAGGSTSDLTVSPGTTGITGASGINITLNADRTVTISENVTATGAGTITVSGNNNTGARNILVNGGAVVSTANGSLLLDADTGSQITGNFVGVDVNGAEVKATGNGTVTVRGRGGDDGSGLQYGVRVNGSGSKIVGGTSGLLTVQGTGGASTGISNYGIFVNDSGTLTSDGASVSITGLGGGSGNGGFQSGVRMENAGLISAGGSGTVTVMGTGGDSTVTRNNHGVSLLSGSTISSSGGNVSVTGTGKGSGTGTNGSQSVGVAVGGGSLITAGGSGTVTVEGTGGNLAGTGVNRNFGVSINSANSKITSSGGNVSVTGTAGGGVDGDPLNNAAILVIASGEITTAANGGTISVIGDSMHFDATAIVSAQSTSSVTLRQKTNGTLIDLGGADLLTGSPLTLGLTDAELDRVTAGTINIGDANSGAITFSADITRAANTNINLTTGSGNNIAFGAFSLNAGTGGDVTLTTSGTGAITTGDNTGTDLTADDVTLNAGSGGIGSTTNFLRFAANTVTATTSGASGINLVEADSVTITASGLNVGTGTITLGGGTFDSTNALSYATPVSINSGATLNANGTSPAYTQTAGTLTVNGTLTANTVSLQGTSTTQGTGTITGPTTIASGATVAPGNSPGILNTGNVTFSSGSTLSTEINAFTTAGTDYDQLNVTGTVSLGNATLSLSGSLATVPTLPIVIINNDGSEAVTGTFNGLAEGATLTLNGYTLAISYVGGSGNDVVLLGADTTIELDGSGNLVITDIGLSTDDLLTIQSNTTTNVFVIRDPGRILATNVAGATGNGTDTVTIPFASVTGSSINVNTLAGDDSLTADLSLGNFGKTLTYNGGTQTTSDSLTLTGGGTFASVAHTFTNANDGSITVTGNSTIHYTGLEPIADNLAAIDRVFTFSGAEDVISLIDADVATMKIDSNAAEEVTFANPTGSLTINAGGGNDSVTIASVDANGPFNAALTINGGTGDDSVNLNADVTFASNKNLDVDLTNDDASPGIDTISVGSGTHFILSGTGAATLKASKNIAFASGSSIAVANGNLTVSANQGTTATTGDFFGVHFNIGGNLSTVNGNILVEGRGGNTADDYGIQSSGHTISSTGTGTLTLHGIGVGASSRGFNSAGSLVTSVSGDIRITGESSQDNGIELNFGSDFVSTGTGVNASDILVIGTTTSTGGGAVGVRLHNSSGDINTVDGNVELRGTTASSSGFGVSVGAGFDIAATGTGSVTLDGDGLTVGVTLGDAGASGTITTNSGAVIVTSPDDVTLTNQGTITATTGSVTITADDDSTGTGLVTLSGSVQFNTSGNISVNATDLSMSGTINAGSGVGAVALTTNTLDLTGTVDGSGTLTIKPRAAATSIGVGTSPTGTLNLNDTELTKLLDGFSSITIGDVTAGTGAVDVNTSTFTDSVTIAGGSISVTELSAGSNSVTLIARTGAITDGGDSGTDVTGGTVSLQTLGVSDGSIGATGDALSLAATNLNTTSAASNGNQFLREADSVTIDAAGLNAGTGTIELSAGTFTLGGANRIHDNSKLNIDGATFAIGANPETVNTLTLTNGSVTGSTGVLTSTNTIQTQAGTISAILAGSNGLTKSTTGQVTLSAANTFTGATTIDAGTLFINGSITSNVTVNTGATLGGSGNGTTTGKITGNVTGAGDVGPGNSPGQLTLTGDFTQQASSDLNIEIDGLTAGTQYDQLAVGGTVTLGGQLNVSLLSSFGPTAANSFRIIDNVGSSAISGTFQGLNEGATFVAGDTTFTISYVGGTGNDVVLTPLTPDILLNSVTTDGNTTLTVRYQVLNSALANPLDLRFLRSTDRLVNVGDSTLSDVSISNLADRRVGTHELTFVIGKAKGQVALPGAGSAKDPDTDSFVLAVADPNNTITELDTDNLNDDNATVFAGAYATSKGVFVYAGASADTVTLTYPDLPTDNVTLTIRGSLTADYQYSYGLTSLFRIRTHEGNDLVQVVRSSNPQSVPAKAMFQAGGDGDDTLTSDVGKDVLVGGDGLDTFVASGDVNFVLTNSKLTGLGTDTLNGIESAQLTGGASSNTFTLTGWTGTGSLTGGGVNSVDSVVVSRDVDFTLSDSMLQTSDGMSLALSGINRAMLTGGQGSNNIHLTGWTGTGKITGGVGIDTLSVMRDTNITLTTTSSLTVMDSAGYGTMTLATIDAVNLTGGTGSNAFTLIDWRGTGSIIGGGGNDTLSVTAKKGAVNFALTNTQLVMTNGLSMSLSGIGTAHLTGSTSANAFDVGGWTGSGSLNGGGGKGLDTVIASANADFTLAGDQLILTSGLSMTLSAVKRASLMGLAQTHRFVVTGWTPAGTSDVAEDVLLSFSR